MLNCCPKYKKFQPLTPTLRNHKLLRMKMNSSVYVGQSRLRNSGEETVEYLNTVDKSSRATCCCSWQSLDRVDDYYLM